MEHRKMSHLSHQSPKSCQTVKLEPQSRSHGNRSASAAVFLEIEEIQIIEIRAVRNSEDRVIKRVKHFKTILQVDTFPNLECFEYAEIDRFNAIAAEGIASNIPNGVPNRWAAPGPLMMNRTSLGLAGVKIRAPEASRR
jgi:hypothetical protein